MATTSSASSVLTSTGLRSSGLISGLDTESIVKQMSAATKSKINKQQQKLDLLSWKQTSYRSVISKISNFKSTYFNTLKPSTNLSSNYLMGAYKAVSSNSKITATASTNAAKTSYTISNIGKLSENAQIKSSESITSGIKLDFSGAEANTDVNLKITLDGFSKDITFNTGADADAAKANFNAALQSAFNSGFSLGTDNTLTYTAADNVSHSFSVGVSDKLDGDDYDAKDKALAAIGLTANTSSRISSSSKLENVNFSTALAGGSYSFKINDVSFNFDKSATISDIISKVNGSDANVTMSFDTLAQKFTLQSNDPGSAGTLKVEQTSGNLLTAMFGEDAIGASNKMSTSVLKQSSLTGMSTQITDFNSMKNTTIQITVNGVTKDIGIWGYDSNGDKNDYSNSVDSDGKITKYGGTKVADTLNEELKREFGTNAPTVTFDTEKSQFTLKASTAGDTITIGGEKDYPVGSGSDLLQALGYIPRDITIVPPDEDGNTVGYEFATTALSGDEKLSDLLGDKFTAGTIGGISIDENTTLDDLNSLFNVNLDNGTFVNNGVLSADDDGGEKLLENLFGDTYANINSYTSSAEGTTTKEVTGTNAEVTINGVTISNTSNNIEIDGTTINIGNLSESDITAINNGEAATITTSRDTSGAYDAVVKFVNDYNTLISDLYSEIQTNRPTDDGTLTGDKYDPLTEEQREDMSDTEIENWEEKAKQGLLYQDSTISNFLTKLRSAMNTRTSDNFSLNDMGITVSSTYSDNGKLVIDEAKLKTAFEKYPDKIQELFTDTTKGLSAQVTKAVDNAISTTRGSLGSLTRIAGIANTGTQSENTISNQIKSYQELIEKLKTRYEDEQERYWKQFTNLEIV